MGFKISQLLEYSFVHIIAVPRSGSSILHRYVTHPWPRRDARYKQFLNNRQQTLGEGIMLQEHLSEPFNVKNFGARRPEFLAEQTAQAQALCYDIHQHTQRYVCMKNLIEDLVKFDDDTQDMLFNLPGITVGLYRHKTFDQTCSDYIAKIFMKLGRSVEVIQQDWRTSFEKQIFLRELRHNIQQKQFMHSMADRFDVMIPYEEIKNQFPPHLINWKNPPHSHTIINYDQVVAWYDEYMQTAGFHKKVTHKGINFVIDKTGQHKA